MSAAFADVAVSGMAARSGVTAATQERKRRADREREIVMG